MSENSHDQVPAESERDPAAPLGATEGQDAEIARLSQQLQQCLAESQDLRQRLEETEQDRVAQRALLRQNAETLQQYKEIIQQCTEVIHHYAEIIQQRDEILCQRDETLCQRDETLCQRDETLRQRDETLHQRDETLRQRDETLRQQAEALTRLQIDKEQIRQTLLTVSHTRAYKLLRALGRWEIVAQTLSLVASQPAEQPPEPPAEQPPEPPAEQPPEPPAEQPPEPPAEQPLEHRSSIAPSPLEGEGWDGGGGGRHSPRTSSLASPPPLPSPIKGEGAARPGSPNDYLTDVLEQPDEQPLEPPDDVGHLPSRTLTHIAVDLTPLLPGGKNGGARVVVPALLRHLIQAAPEVEFALLTSEQNHEGLAVLEAANVRRFCMTKRQSQAHALLTAGGLPWDMKVDLLFCPCTAPFCADPAIPLVSVVHDLQYLSYPQFFSPEAIRERDTHFRHATQQAKRLICVSDYVRQTVLDHTAVQPEGVTTIHTGLPRKATRLVPEQLMAVLERSGLRAGRFLLYPANFWPHKNHRMLLTAFKIYRARNPGSDLGLVCTGTPNADMESLRDAVARMELEGEVSFPGYGSDEVFTALLQACRALIFPSLYEGFGIPVLEAMAFGKPVLCSRVTSLPEVAGDAAVYFDPRKPAEIVRAIEHIESDAELAERLIHLGYERLTTFGDASELAQRYLQVFRDVVHDFHYPPYTLHGIYADGWIGSRAVIAYGASAEQRHLELVLTLPPGTPYPWVSAEVRHHGHASTVPCILTCGKEELIRLELSRQEGYIELLLVPAFQARVHDLGEDVRLLGGLCQACRIVSAHSTEDLLVHVMHVERSARCMDI